MAKQTITIETVLGGISSLQYFAPKGGYHAGMAIDPDMPVSDSATRLSGFIRPTAMEKFSGTTITASPKWIVTNPKDANAYVYDSSGKVYTINSSLTVTALNSGTALTSSTGNGSEYYDNAMYFAKNTDIARYSALNGSPSFNETYWSSTLSKAVLTNTTYPTINGVLMPNHVMHRHTDNKMYICDVLSNTTANTNKGGIHYITSSKTTVEGDTNSASSYDALDLGYGYWPTTLESYGTDLAVAMMEGNSTAVKQKPAALAFWDTTSSSFSKLIQIEFPDPIITAMKNVNGILYVWSGNVTGGYRVTRFIGGYSFEEVWFSEEGFPPTQGAVDGEMNRVIWGTPITYPEAGVCVMAYGSRSAKLGNGIHNILKTTSAGANGNITAIKYFQVQSNGFRQPIVGWKDDSAQGIDKLSTTYGTSVFRSEVYRIGRPFTVGNIRLPLAQTIGANNTATVKVYVDNGSSSTTVKTISSTSVESTARNVKIYEPVNGQHDFFIELRTTGTALTTFVLPITIEVNTKED